MSTDTVAVAVLVRHGRTPLNAEGKLRGHADPDLDRAGLAEVEATARALRACNIQQVVSSPLRRATATADAITRAPGARCATFTVDPAFIDRDYGPWTAHSKEDVTEQWGSLDAAPGVEPAPELVTRAVNGLDRHAAPGAVVAVVTHDAIIRAVLDRVQPGIDPAVATASWAVLHRDETGWRIESVDNTAGSAHA